MAYICFDFPEKLHMHTYLSGRQNKNKLKEKYGESSEQLVNRVLTSLYTSLVPVDSKKKYARLLYSFPMYKVNRRSTAFLQSYHIPSAKRYPEQRITNGSLLKMTG